MKVRPILLELNDEQKCYFKSTSQARYQLTIGKSYVVYAVEFVPNSVTDFTLYRLVDDGNRLLPVPACLLELVDPRVSKYWRATYDPKSFGLKFEPQEFIDDPCLSEAILDREPEAWTVFRGIRTRMEAEGLQII
jgi:hypothetical protein